MPFINPRQTAGAIPYNDRKDFLLKLATWSTGEELLFWLARIDYENQPTYQKALAIQDVFITMLDMNLNEQTKIDLHNSIFLWKQFLDRKMSLTPTQRRELTLSVTKIILLGIVNGGIRPEDEISSVFIDKNLPWKSSSIKDFPGKGEMEKMKIAISCLNKAGISI
ncbi:hypothetical protein QWY85_08300 [Neolewinella lacunae]|uniref:Uncharacterized protein n=1 Tax=Neolewinella lacunae TaxID=1517758 RepID=A0A923PHJ3_9BACT|nr:hypothetical protein [Neolewinella lacunae]MBC6994187.1 hypothetical protein [Neolewinella lacunae]MDN3634654.1 hypothetical protein [Neolewinella lacunae]